MSNDTSDETSQEILTTLQINPTLGTAICDGCNQIFSDKRSNLMLSSAQGLQYRRKRSDMEITDINGCETCYKLLTMYPSERWKIDFRTRGLITKNRNWGPPTTWRSRAYKLIGFEQSFFAKEWLDNLRDPYICFQLRWDDENPSRILVTQHIPLKSKREGRFQLRAQFDDPAAQHISARESNPYMKCISTYELIRTWLKDCEDNHPDCPKPHSANKLWPSLLVDIMNSDVTSVVRLIETSKLASVPRYATLSYCWGGPQRNATSTSNLEAYQHRIDLESLPQTLQDAVYVTRQIGLQYLWIDSLCIIQDSETQKCHEIGKMEHIYTHSFVTISANSAKSCEEGFLQNRNNPAAGFMKGRIPFTCEDSTVGSVSISPLKLRGWVVSELGDWHPTNQPIDSRAWILQEHFLSSRMLLFTDRQLFWVCKETWGKDGGGMSRDAYFFGGEFSSRNLISPGPTDWISIIKQYLQKHISDPSDMLPALSSIAAYFSSILDDQYLAGLWRKQLFELLCWQAEDIISGTLQRPSVWRSPSWSYMSINGKIKFEIQRMILSHPSHGTDSIPEILECEVQPRDLEAPFSHVQPGHLRVSGKLIQVQPDLNDLPLTWHSFETMEVSAVTGHKEHGVLTYDTMRMNGSEKVAVTNYGIRDPQQPAWCLMFYYTNNANMPNLKHRRQWKNWGLVLDRLPDGRFHRIGHFTMYFSFDVFFQSSRQTIDIV